MLKLGAAHIIAIDVGSQDDTDLTDYGYLLKIIETLSFILLTKFIKYLK